MITDRAIEDRLRTLTPQVLGALTRRYGVFDLCEDAVQEALVAAATQWPEQGIPDDPRAWLITAASRRLTDLLRSEGARRRREERAASLEAPATSRRPAPRSPPTPTTACSYCSCAAIPCSPRRRRSR